MATKTATSGKAAAKKPAATGKATGGAKAKNATAPPIKNKATGTTKKAGAKTSNTRARKA